MTHERALETLIRTQLVCACGCPAHDHTLAAQDNDQAIWLCIACLHGCPGLPRNTVSDPHQKERE